MELEQAIVARPPRPAVIAMNVVSQASLVRRSAGSHSRPSATGITPTIRRELRRRSAIEAMIGHMKLDGKLARNHLKGALGDAVHALLCGAGHNLRLILRHLASLLRALLAAPAPNRDITPQSI